MKELTPEFIAALAECMGGTLLPVGSDEESRYRRNLPSIRFENPRCRLSLSTCWQPRGKWHASVQDLEGRHISQSSSANFTPTRSLADIAADIRRRVLEPSRTAIIEHGSKRASASVADQELRERVGRLEQVFGVPNDTQGYSHNHFVRLPQFRISSQYHLQGTASFGRFTAEISVDSFDCLLMIARLVAEDHKLQRGSGV